MKCLVNLLCTLLIASVNIESNVAQTSSRTTYEDVARQREIAETENYLPATLPETTTPLVPDYMPGEGVYAQPELPDYNASLKAAQYEEPYIAKERSNSYSEALSKNSYRGQTPPPPPLDPYGPKVNIRETHTMGSDGVWRPRQIASLFTAENIFVFLVIEAVLFYVLFIMGDNRARRKSPPTETEKKWISCDSTISTNTNNSRTIQDMHQIASPINILGKQTGDLEKVITFISTLIEEGIKNFSSEGLSKAQQLEIFLFDACMAKNLLLAKEKIPNVYVPEIDKKINAAYRNFKDKPETKMDEFLDTKALIEIRTPFYLNDLQGLIESSTEMYMPYSLYFFICEAPLESILNKEKVFEEIKRIQSDTRILEKMVLFMKNFEPHYNWLLGRINSF